MKATGNLNNTTRVESVMNIDLLSSDVVGLVGEPFDINTASNFDEAILSFKVDPSKLGDTSFTDLIFLWFDEENQEYKELSTQYDNFSFTVSTTVTHFSKYMIVDKLDWYKAWSVNLFFHTIKIT